MQYLIFQRKPCVIVWNHFELKNGTKINCISEISKTAHTVYVAASKGGGLNFTHYAFGASTEYNSPGTV